MIIDRFVSLKINSSNLNFYKNKYNCNIGDIISINIIDLSKGSSVRINAKCEICGNIQNIQYYNYNNILKKHNYYVCKKCKKYKVKITNLEKYGCICPLQNIKIKEKSYNTMILKYGVDNISKLDYIKEKRKDNFKIDNFKNKSKITILKKYGFDNVSKSKKIKNKKIQTCLKNWGVENPSQSTYIFEKLQISGKKIKKHDKIDIMYRGTYELDFLNFCYKHNINVKKGLTIKYTKNNKLKYYHSDFYLPDFNLICEVKSDYYYKKYLETNLLKSQSCINLGYNFIFIIDKDYNNLKNIIYNNNI